MSLRGEVGAVDFVCVELSVAGFDQIDRFGGFDEFAVGFEVGGGVEHGVATVVPQCFLVQDGDFDDGGIELERNERRSIGTLGPAWRDSGLGADEVGESRCARRRRDSSLALKQEGLEITRGASVQSKEGSGSDVVLGTVLTFAVSARASSGVALMGLSVTDEAGSVTGDAGSVVEDAGSVTAASIAADGVDDRSVEVAASGVSATGSAAELQTTVPNVATAARYAVRRHRQSFAVVMMRVR